MKRIDLTKVDLDMDEGFKRLQEEYVKKCAELAAAKKELAILAFANPVILKELRRQA